MLPLKSLENSLATTTNVSIIRERVKSIVQPPLKQNGPVECPNIDNFSYPELAVADFPNAIITRSGAVIVEDRFVVEETVEGPLESNNFAMIEGDYWFDDKDVEEINDKVINFSKFGIFNYSIFLTEIMPCAYLLSLNQEFSQRNFYIHFPPFMSGHATELRWRAFEACGFKRHKSISTTKSGVRAKSVGISKANDRYKNHRANQMTSGVAALLRGTFADSERNSPERIYIRRRGNVARRIEEFSSLEALLKLYGITPVSLEDASIEQQINLFSKANIVVGEHGAGLVNTMFMRPGSSMIEMFPQPLIGRWAFRLTAHTFNLNYLFNSFPVSDGWKWDKDPVRPDEEALERLLTFICS